MPLSHRYRALSLSLKSLEEKIDYETKQLVPDINGLKRMKCRRLALKDEMRALELEMQSGGIAPPALSRPAPDHPACLPSAQTEPAAGRAQP